MTVALDGYIPDQEIDRLTVVRRAHEKDVI
jgi:hypothetical protein